MGKFWSEKEMKAISKKLNLKGTYIEQPKYLPNMHYRFDYLFDQINWSNIRGPEKLLASMLPAPIKEKLIPKYEGFPDIQQLLRIGADKVVMVDCALFAIEELMAKHPECLLYGQDVGGRLGGVFREAATLAQKFGDNRVFNTAIQEAFIVGSTVGMSAVGLKPIVEVQFADYLWPGLNQLFTEVSRSCYLSNGKWPVSMILRVPIGAYGSGGPYHSSSMESVVSNIRGLKIAYPSNGADLKGLIKAAYYDPNPVVIFEHKGLYWSKVPGTKGATSVEPSEDYMLPFGKAWVLQEIWKKEEDETLSIITYGMGVHWAINATAALGLQDVVEIVDLRTLHPLDYDTVFASVNKCGKCLVVTEEPSENSFSRVDVRSIIDDTLNKNLCKPSVQKLIVQRNALVTQLNFIGSNLDKITKAIEEFLLEKLLPNNYDVSTELALTEVKKKKIVKKNSDITNCTSPILSNKSKSKSIRLWMT